MEDLLELTFIVNKNKVKKIDLLNLSGDESNKVNSLYKFISSNGVSSDEEAFNLLYPDPQENSKSAYNNIKSKLRNKLLNTLFFIDTNQSSYTDRQKAFYEVNKLFAAGQLLMAKSARKSGIYLLEKVCRIAEKFEFTEVALLSSRILRLHYGTRVGNINKYNYYNLCIDKYHRIESAENRAEKYYSDLLIQYLNNLSTKEELQTKAKQYYRELRDHPDRVDTYKYYMYMEFTRLLFYTIVSDYRNTIDICDEIINFFEQKPYEANTPIQICLHHQLVGCLQSKLFLRGEQIANKSRTLLEEGSFNWFKNQEYFFLLAMYTANYQKAYTIFSEAVNHPRFSFLPQKTAEFWTVYRAYLHFLYDLEKIHITGGDKNFTSFRINRFLNEVPLFSKDKGGMNIAVLIVQILFYIDKKKYKIAIDRVEAIEKYCSRYLFKDGAMRSYYFIKALLTLPKASFHKKAVIRYSDPHINKLRSISMTDSYEYHKIEIIPYESLWELVLETLELRIVNLNAFKKRSERKELH